MKTIDSTPIVACLIISPNTCMAEVYSSVIIVTMLSIFTMASLAVDMGALKSRDLTSRDLTTRHHIARVDIARLVSVFE